MRRTGAWLLAVLLAACQGPPRAPDLDGAPARRLESRRQDGRVPAGFVRSCLFVFNHTGETAAIFVDGRHAGWVGPRSSAAFVVGLGAASRSKLLATTPGGRFEATVHGSVQDLAWHLER